MGEEEFVTPNSKECDKVKTKRRGKGVSDTDNREFKGKSSKTNKRRTLKTQT